MISKNLINLFKKPIFTVITTIMALCCFIVCFFVPEYSFNQVDGTIQFVNPESIYTTTNSKKVIVDNRNNIYCLESENQLNYAIDINQFPYDNAEIIDITTNSNNHLFCHIVVYNQDSYLTDYEVIYEIDSNGELIREVLRYDYRESQNPPSHQSRIIGLHTYNDSLYYLHKDEKGYSMIKLSSNSPQHQELVFIAQEDFSEIVECRGTDDGRFLVLKNNGEIGYISYNGNYEVIYKSDYNLINNQGIFPQDVIHSNGSLYMLAGQNELVLYKWNNTQWDYVLSVTKSTNTSNEDLYTFGLGIYNNLPALHLNDKLYTLNSDNTLTQYSPELSLPFAINIHMWLDKALPIIGLIILLVAIISGIGNLMKWRLNILSKQLLSTIPVVLILLTVVIVIMFISMINLSTEDILKETIAINEIAASQFDAKELAEIKSFDSVDNGQIQKLNQQLRLFVNGNKSDWSKNYSTALYIRAEGEKFLCIASSDESNKFMANSFSTDYPIHQEFYENTHTFAADVSIGEDQDNIHLLLITPIYNDNGTYDAFILLNASQDRLTKELIIAGKRLLLHVTIWVILLIIIISIVSARNAKSLKKAQNVVTQIASGDFSLRIDTYSNDEVGEICAGVNNMAERLEEYFEEKNRNEQFYYKFVPEKFRELLHKDNFTDLALGDAQSADLSILFCDIRAFSLNSEMMTVRESFDFVNRIYGKAGPIIRKHNGFIDKYIGDAIMALFESADDAVAAGIELYQAIVLNPNSVNDFGLPSVNVGIGIHSGMARIGIVGEKERMSGTVISNTVNLSSRIESLTKRYGAGMIISKDTLDRMRNPDMLSTRYLGMVQVAGVKEVAALYEVMDCLDEAQKQKKSQTKDEFREAVRLFHTGQLKASLDSFKQLSTLAPDDKASELYVAYISDIINKKDTQHNVFCFENKQ